MQPYQQSIDFTIDVQQNILQQFAQQLAIPIINNEAKLDNAMGKGLLQFQSFPNQLEFYYFNCTVNQPIKINSYNPQESDWLLLNINLSTETSVKTVNNQSLNLQKYLPSGILYYSPQTKVENLNPAGEKIEIVIIRFPKAFLNAYVSKDFPKLENTQNALIYEDLDSLSERQLIAAINPTHNLLKRHSAILHFLAIFIEKLTKRTYQTSYHQLHPNDVKGLFLAAAQLRNPIGGNLPNIEQLAQIAGMSATKFKTYFKQVFGNPPMKYRQKIRMEYARQLLENKQKTISEISYELGYAHPSKFMLAYKKAFHQLPSKV